MSYLKFGSYQHAPGEAALQPIGREAIFSDAGQAYGYRHRWQVSGYLQGTSPSDLQTKILALEAAYATLPGNIGNDLWLYNDDGSKTPHGINNAQTLAGVRVVALNYPIGNGSQLVDGRDYEIELEFEVYAQQDGLIAWQETVNLTGGGPRIVYKEPLVLLPIKQITKLATTYYATQSGSATGLRSYPNPPGPIWPANVLPPAEITRDSPKRHGNSYTEYRIAWTYRFGSPTVLNGVPNPWPR